MATRGTYGANHNLMAPDDVISKFMELHRAHYVPHGYMLRTVPDDDAAAAHFLSHDAWTPTYNSYASDRVPVSACRVEVPLLGRTFALTLNRPIQPEHRSEFETYFGFGRHCAGYTEKRIVACFQSSVDPALDVAAALQGGVAVDAKYAQQALQLLVLGGYVKRWAAVAEFERWFVYTGVLGPQDCGRACQELHSMGVVVAAKV